MSDSVMLAPKPSRKYWRILAYSLGSILLVFALFRGYQWYRDQQDWVAIEAMLAEQDHKQPGWRWSTFEPSALKLGEKNGALRFMEVGKHITSEMLVGPEVPVEDNLDFRDRTRERLVTLERLSYRELYRRIREQCQPLEVHLPKLRNYLPGCVPLVAQRPSVHQFLGIGPQKEQLFEQNMPWWHCHRWLTNLALFHIQEGNADQAVEVWLCLMNMALCEPPGKFFDSFRSRMCRKQYRLLNELLAKTEPSDQALLAIHRMLEESDLHFFTLDDIHMDRAITIQLLEEPPHSSSRFSKIQQAYVPDYPWMPESWRDWCMSKGVGSHSQARMHRLECESHLRWFAFLEQQVQQNSRFRNMELEEAENSTRYPGMHFQKNYASTWRFIIHDSTRWHADVVRMQVLLAAERFRLKHHRMPVSWNELIPAFLPVIPTLGTNRPLNIKAVSDGFVVYSPWGSNKDLGGKVLLSGDGRVAEEIDEGQILFHPHLRRQPPPPREAPKERENQ